METLDTTNSQEQTNVLPAELTKEELAELEKKEKDLAEKYKVSRVHSVVFFKPITNERMIAFIKQPPFVAQIGLMDKSMQVGAYSAGDEAMEVCLLRDESHYLTYSENPESDKYRMAIIQFCIANLVNIAVDQKKRALTVK